MRARERPVRCLRESKPARLREKARFPWHEVTKIAHYWLQVDALTQPMEVREEEEEESYGQQHD